MLYYIVMRFITKTHDRADTMKQPVRHGVPHARRRRVAAAVLSTLGGGRVYYYYMYDIYTHPHRR